MKWRFRLLARRALLVVAIAVLGGVAVAAWVFLGGQGTDNSAAAATSSLKLEDIPFDGLQAYEYLKRLCAIGPRRSGSAGMAAQQRLLAEHFQKLGGQVEFQQFGVRHPHEASVVPMTNILVHWHPQSTARILLCGHYDTLPYPMRDKENPRGIFVGANDNASGVAILMELARDMPTLPTKYGVDFLLLDGEEFIFSEQDRFFLGSEYFAREYVKQQATLSLPVGRAVGHGRRCRFADLRGAEQRVVERHPCAGRPTFGPRRRGSACGSSWPNRSTKSKTTTSCCTTWAIFPAST